MSCSPKAGRRPSRRRAPKDIPFLTVAQQFNRGTDEGFYGLGQHQNGQMNYNGEDVELAQHNMDVAIPFVVSTRNYGLLWDNNSITRFGNPRPYRAELRRPAVNDGGWSATYSANGKVIAQRTEPAIDAPISREPQGLAGRHPHARWRRTTFPASRSIWTGTFVPGTSGLHRFRLYSSSYAKVFVDGSEVLSKWRQNWNPWYHNFDLELAAGKPHDDARRMGAERRLYRARAQ